MAWDDRLRDAVYISPAGRRISFKYENVSWERDKKTTAFEFPDADGTYVQQSGSSGRRYPMRCIFTGANCDLEAAAFERALFDAGVGVLTHPMYGTVDVVPFGTVKRRDELKTAANQAIVEVTFFATIGLIYPLGLIDYLSTVIRAVSAFTVAIGVVLGTVIGTTTAVQQAVFKSGFLALLSTMRSGLEDIAATDDEVLREFDLIVDSIEQSIDTLAHDPVTLASQTVIGIQVPAKATTDIEDRLVAYNSLLSSVMATSVRDEHDFYTKDLYASAYVTGEILSVINTQFTTRTGAIEAAVFILEQFDQLVAWRDDNMQTLELIDTGEAYQQLQEAVAITAGFLVDISFTLKQERFIVLDRARTIVDLTAQLYGEVDNKLDFLIETNNLSGSEILELPKGKEIVFYI